MKKRGKKKRYKTNTELEVAAELVTAWWLMCKQLNQSCTNPVLVANPASPSHTQQPIRSSVSVCRECKHTFGYEQEAHNSAG